MVETRFDPLGGRWVILAPERSRRPVGATPDGGPCPFCPGNEHLTPPELARVGTPWRVRVFDNLYPILTGPAGAHEVVVLSPDHHRSLAEVSDDHVLEVLTMLRDRACHHADRGRAFTQLFVNHGPGGGASISHPHAQLVATDLPSPTVVTEAERMVTGAGRCLLCDAVTDAGDLTVIDVGGSTAADAGAVVWCPWWSTTAFELLLAPRHHRRRFEDADHELPAVAAALSEALDRLRLAGAGSSYNLALHSLPATLPNDFHWHAHVWPRLQAPGGFELATGLAVTTVDPAAAARALRSSACG